MLRACELAGMACRADPVLLEAYRPLTQMYGGEKRSRTGKNKTNKKRAPGCVSQECTGGWSMVKVHGVLEISSVLFPVTV